MNLLSIDKIIISLILTSFMVTRVSGEIDSDTHDRISTSVDSVVSVVELIKDRNDALTEAGKAVGTVLSFVGKLAPLLSGLTSFLSILLIFLPQQDSEELTYMKEKFAEVNRKLDAVTNKLDGIQNLITFEAQRAAYIDEEHIIKFGYEKLQEMYKELQGVSCESENDCQRRRTEVAQTYLKHFEKVEASLNLILKNSYSGSDFSEPLLHLVKKYYKCDIAKLNSFADTIFQLTFHGQEVVIAYKRLTGSKTSTVVEIQKWLKLIYALRKNLYEIKEECYQNIGKYVREEVKDGKYQGDFGDDRRANKALGQALDLKYPWLKWNVLSYDAFDNDDQAFEVNQGYYNAPSDEENRERVIVATPVDPYATYSYDVKQKIINVLKEAPKMKGPLMAALYYQSDPVFKCAKDKGECIKEFKENLKVHDLWKYVQSFVILNPKIDVSIRENHPNSFIHQVFEYLPSHHTNMVIKYKFEFILMLKSEEMVSTSNACTKKCFGDSACVKLPFSKLSECQCEENFDGPGCKDHSKNGLAASLNNLVQTTIQVPSLTDIYYDLKNLHKVMDAGDLKMESVLDKLKGSLETSFQRVTNELGKSFQWTNLNIKYADTISELRHFTNEFKMRSKKHNDQRGKTLASYILQPGHIKKWLSELHILFTGSNFIVQDHKPLMIMYMDRYHQQNTCSPTYKNHIDNAFRQFAILQQDAYVMWAEALNLMDEDTDVVDELYKQRFKDQDALYTNLTCKYNVVNSVNIKCSGIGRYIHSSMVFENQCKPNFFIKGPVKSTCKDAVKPLCLPCSCYAPGSIGAECGDQTGQCNCQKSFYGVQCQNKDCVWNVWSGFGSCTRSCGYNSHQTRSRTSIQKHGHGKPCQGPNQQTRSCFQKCCPGWFHCSNKKKCIEGHLKCDYNNNCGDSQDESDQLCQEKCSVQHSPWKEVGNGQDVWTLEGQHVQCPAGSVMQSFKLERSGKSQRYQYRCCNWNVVNALGKSYQYTKWSGQTKYVQDLRQLQVKCFTNQIVTSFKILVKSHKQNIWNPRRYYMKYDYQCAEIKNQKHKERMRCQEVATAWGTQGKGKTQELDRHDVNCATRMGQRWFLNGFILEWKSNTSQIRYKFWCCRVAV